ncbi:hypothetical protein EP51_14360 [Rhodococcus opacus]|uniref:Uncharacterized protein n=1 Tax=Rhodococcus opacus TaxID=37919 RepID=A0A076EKG5_RHOOP|nr:hypothetical protein EP51_14360 [Rhodococcus opacus]
MPPPGGARRFLPVFSQISPNFRPRRHRLTAHGQLTDVTDILDGIEDEADKILADLLRILDDIGTEPRG